jgi:hypothetical protein
MLNHLESRDTTLRMSADIALTYLAIGIQWSNVYPQVEGQRAIYCVPPNIALQNDQLKDMMKRVIMEKPCWPGHMLGWPYSRR